MGERRSVRRPHHHVGVVQEPHHEASLTKRAAQGAGGIAGRAIGDGVLPDQVLGPASIDAVVLPNHGGESGGVVVVIVVVQHVGGPAGDGGRGHELQSWVGLLDGIVEHRKAVAIVGAAGVEPVFVADLHVRQRIRRRVTVGGPPGAPGGGVGVSDDVFDLVERVLHVGPEIRLRHHRVVQRVAGEHREQRLGASGLGHVEVGLEPDVVSGPVAPGVVLVAGAILERADGGLPVEPSRQRVALEVVSARHSPEAWLGRPQQRHDVLSECVGGTEGRRHHLNQLEVDRARPGSVGIEYNPVLCPDRDGGLGGEREGVLRPRGRERADGGAAGVALARARLEAHRHRAREASGGTRVEARGVGGRRSEADPVEAGVGDPDGPGPSVARNGQSERKAVLSAQRLGAVGGDDACAGARRHQRPRGRSPRAPSGAFLHGGVADQVGVEAALHRVVDVLDDVAPLRRVGGHHRLVHLHREDRAGRGYSGVDRTYVDRIWLGRTCVSRTCVDRTCVDRTCVDRTCVGRA